MIVSVIACAESARDWNKTPCDYSILLNDAYKFGHRGDALGIFNHKSKFTPERQKTILKTKPIKLFTHCLSWEGVFDDIVKVKLRSWDGILTKSTERLQHADSSPFIAMSLAYGLSASKIILWGAEMLSHPILNPKNPNWNQEYRQYKGFYEALLNAGCETFIGAGESALNFIPKWTE